MQQAINEEELQNLAFQITSVLGLRLTRCSFIKQASTSAVALLETSDGRLVLRSEAPRPGKVARYEIDAGLRRVVANIDNRIAMPIAVSADFPEIETDASWAIDRYIDGFDGNLETSTPGIWRDLGEVLNSVHSVVFPASTWTATDRFQDPWPLWGRSLQDHPVNKAAPKLIEALLPFKEEISQASEGERVINHGDCGLNNVRIRKGRIVGLLDFNEVFSGPPAWDLAIVRHLGGVKAVDFALKGYGGATEAFKRDIALLSVPFALHRISRANTMNNERHTKHSVSALRRDLSLLSR